MARQTGFGSDGMSASRPRRSRASLASRFLALEKRIVFDGAGAAHADATLHHEGLHGGSERTGDALYGGAKPIAPDPMRLPPGREVPDAQSAPATIPTAGQQIVFIDASVPDVGDLLKRIPANAEVVMIDPAKDGLDQIAAALRDRTDIAAIHIISHGSEANLEIGTSDLNARTMTTIYASDLAVIKHALAPGADLLVYGCDFAKGADGDAAARELAALTGANVAASTDLTGSADLGGDFVLEDQIGAVHTATIDPTTYEGVLAASPVTEFANTGTGLYHPNLEFLDYANTPMATGGITNGATATYRTSDGGTLKVTFSNVVNTANAATFKPSDLLTYGPAKFAAGYNTTAPNEAALYGSYNGSSSFTVSFRAFTKAGVAYNPNVAFIDAETTNSPESYTVTTSGGAFQNVETVGGTGYSLNGIGTNTITLQNTTGTGVPVLVSDGTSSFDITTAIAGGKQGFAFALIKPTLDLDANGSSGAAVDNYQTTFTEKGAAVAVADTDVAAVEPGLAAAASATITVTNAQAGDVLSVGTLPSTISGSIDTSVAGQITVRLTGASSLANYQTAIDAVKFSTTSSDPSTVDRTIDVTYNDGAINSNTAVATVHVVAVNDPPVETTPAGQSVNKDTPTAIAGLSVGDVDANGGAETVTLSVTHGTISLGATSGLSFASGTGTNDTSVTFTGALANIDTAIGGLTYRPTTGFVGSDQLSFSTNDNGNTGAGGAMSASKTVAITVANVDPTARGTLPNTIVADGTANVSIPTASGFSDSLGLSLSYSATGLPAGLRIDAATGIISGTLNHDASVKAPVATGSGATLDGTYTIAVTADDGQGGQAIQTFTLDARNQAPVIGTVTPSQSAIDGQTIAPIRAADAFTDPNTGDVLTFAATGLPPGLSISATTGIITGTVAATASRQSPYTARVTATDDKGAVTTESFGFAIADAPPVATGTLLPPTLADGTTGVSIATATGFTNPLGLDTYTATGLPAGLTINAATGAISGTLDHDASKNAPVTTGSGATLDGRYTIVVTAADGQGGSATQTVTLDATNQAPVVGTPTSNQHGYDGNAAALETAGVFADPNGGDILTYSATGLPTGLAINPATGRISGTIDRSASRNGPFQVAVTATDDKSAATTESFTWVVDNVPPTATPPLPNQAMNDGATVAFATSGGFVNPLGLPLTYSATGLPAGLSIDPMSGMIAGTIDHQASVAQPGGSYRVTVHVDDGQGGTADNPFTLVLSNQAPLVTAPTPGQTGADGQTIAPLNTAAAFTDPNTGDTVTYAVTGLPKGLAIDPTTGIVSGTIDSKASVVGAYTVQVTATDDKGAATVESFTYTVSDTPPVMAAALPDQIVADGTSGIAIATSSGFSDTLGRALVYTATGLPTGLGIDPVTGIISGALNHEASLMAPSTSGSGATLDGRYTVTVTAGDGQGGSVSQSFSLDATNQAPTVVARTTDQASFGGDTTSVNAAAAFADPNQGDTVTYAASGLPQGLAINPATGVISGTIAASAALTPNYAVQVTATDDKGAGTTETFAWTVGTRLPSSTGIPAQAVDDGLAIAPIATGQYFSGTGLTFSAAGLPAGLAIDASTGTITGTMAHDASVAGPYSVSVTATDILAQTTTQTLVVTSTNQAPTVAAQTPNQTGTDGASFSLNTATAFADPNTGDTLTFAASGLPSGLSINAAGQISGTLDPRASLAGPVPVTVTATDDKGLSASETFTITAMNAPPVALGSLAAVSMPDSTTGIAIATAGGFSDPLALPLTYTASGLPTGLVIDPATGVISGRLDHDASANAPAQTGLGATLVGTYTVLVSASDGQGGVATRTLSLSATNQAPTLVAQTPDQIAFNGNSAPVNIATAFADPNLGDHITYAASGLPHGLAIDPSTGIITGTLDKSAASNGPYTVVATATDDKGAATSETFVWTTSKVVPVATPPLPDLAVDDSQSVHIATAGGFTNPLGLGYTYSVTGLPAGLTLDPTTGVISGTIDHDASKAAAGGVYTVSVTADDGQGGQATNTFSIVSSNQAPLVSAATASLNVVAGTPLNVALGAAFADPNHGDVLTYAAAGLPTGLSIDSQTGLVSGTVNPTQAAGVYTVTVTAIDDKGASASESVTLTVRSPGAIQPPNAVPVPPITTADGQAIAPIDIASHFTDPSGLPLTLSVAGLPSGLSFDPSTGLVTGTLDHDASKTMPAGGYVVTATGDDGHGGTAATVFTITATNQAPQLGTPTATRTGSAGAPLGFDASTAFHDPNIGDAITYGATGLPAGLAIDPATGIVSGTIDKAAQPGRYTVVVTATDDKGAAAAETLSMIVAPMPPVATAIPAVTVADGTVVTPIDVASHFTDPNGYPLTLTVSGLPNGLGFDPATGTIHGTIDHDASKVMPTGGYPIVVTATDSQGDAASTTFTLTSVNSAPVLGASTRDRVAAAGSTARINISRAFSDPNPGDVLGYTASGLPSGLVIDPSTGIVTGTIDPTVTPGAYTVTATATDDKGASTAEQFIVTVTNPPPVVTPIQPVTVTDGEPIAPIDLASHFSDYNHLPLTLTVTGLPDGLRFDPATGLVTGTPDHDSSAAMPVGGYVIVVSASDGKGGTAATTFSLTSVHAPPIVVTSTPDQTVAARSTVRVDTAPAFVDPSMTLTYTAVGLPSGLVVDPKTGVITGTLDASVTPGRFSVSVTAADDAGAAASDHFIITVTAPPATAINATPPVVPRTQGPVTLGPVTPRPDAPDPTLASPAAAPLVPLTADGIVLDTVRASSAITASAPLSVDRVVVGAVNNIVSLGGLPTLSGSRGVVREAVRAGGADGRARDDLDVDATPEPVAPPSDFLGASLRSADVLSDAGPTDRRADRIAVETLIRDNVIFIAMTVPHVEDGAAVVAYTMTRADGEPLPLWLEQSRRGLVFGKLPSDRHRIDLRITAILGDGRRLARVIVVDPTAGQITDIPARR